MVQKVDQGTIFILDIGRNVSKPDEKNQKSFFENARDFAMRLIERKIISQGMNLVGIILLGSKETNNNMAAQCEGAYRHIQLLAELSTPTWNMIRDMPEKPSNSMGDWIDALIVAAEHFKSQSSAKIVHQKIILMTNFLTPTVNSAKDIEMVLDGFKEEKFEVDIIGPNLYDDNFKGDDVEIARQFVEATDGATANFDYAMQYLSFHRKKTVNAKPWNADLSIGPNIKIPVSAFIRLKDEPVVKNWRIAVKDPVTDRASTSEGVMKTKFHVNVENQDIVEKPDIIKGFHYGQKIIPFSDSDKSMLYESGERCLTVYGFTNYCNISWQSLNGDSLYYVFGQKGDKKAQHAIKCLVECLHETNLVGIVRKVHNKSDTPKMFALFPVIDTNNYVCLSMTALCFKEDIKYMSFPATSLKKYACTDEQVNAFKSLIKAMDLTRVYDESYDDTEAFPVARTVSPFAQYVLDCIAFRAMNPGKPLPKPRDDIMNLFKVPSEVDARSKEPLDKLKSLFILNKIEKKQRRKKANILNDTSFDASFDTSIMNEPFNNIGHDNIPTIKLPLKQWDEEEVSHIKTIDPISDFLTLKKKDKTLATLAPEMTLAIEDLIYCNLDGDYMKASEVMSFFRKECVKDDPSHYNNWMQKFKVDLNDRKKSDVLSLICERNLNFILKSENSLSTFETENCHDESQMYENNTIPNSEQLTIDSEFNDLFDEF